MTFEEREKICGKINKFYEIKLRNLTDEQYEEFCSLYKLLNEEPPSRVPPTMFERWKSENILEGVKITSRRNIVKK
ncbi:MAG: hypothetical protein ACTTHM_07530 [Peptoanaerobacter stomatis]|uniref:hypothetical protein n=1 Tax=Peptoanaerobacter stomatis TaxID=796937 RepID=UPI003F9ED5B0